MAFYILCATTIIGLLLFICEIKNAPTVDNKEPFLWDDYKPNSIT